MRNLLSYAGYGLILSGLLHFPAFVLGGMGAGQLVVLGAGILYVVVGWALTRHVRFLACVTFAVMLVGLNVALGFALGGVEPIWAYWTIFGLDMFVALCLFVYIWKGRRGYDFDVDDELAV